MTRFVCEQCTKDLRRKAQYPVREHRACSGVVVRLCGSCDEQLAGGHRELASGRCVHLPARPGKAAA